MIQEVYFKHASVQNAYELKLEQAGHAQQNILLKAIHSEKVKNVSFTIKLSKKIIAYRSIDYKWNKITKNQDHILNEHCPKILVLEDHSYVMSSKNIGAWELIDHKTIEWVLKSPELHPVFEYGQDNIRIFKTAFTPEDYNLTLLFSKDAVPEFSRSKIAFKPMVCFTDHCDFDNNELVKKQLEFFNQKGVKISKGFFLNHFSKRKENSSYQNDKALLLQFKHQGHELFYHALSQSLRKKDDAIAEFVNFVPPAAVAVNTYIDHGYQPYNYTLRTKSGLSDAQWSKIMSQNGIKNLWTYLDSGTAHSAIINQLNPKHFTPKKLFKHHFLRPLFVFRTLLFYSGNEDVLVQYKQTAKFFKQAIAQKSIKKTGRFLSSLSKCFFYVVKVLSNSAARNRSFKYAKYTPFVFKDDVNGQSFRFFQTVEVTNFEKTFSQKNIDGLIDQTGAIIVHCYFSSPIKHQKGRLFKGGKISDKNHKNFSYLGDKIKNGEIWNPTINELIDYTAKTSQLEFYLSEGRIKVNSEVAVRYVAYG